MKTTMNSVLVALALVASVSFAVATPIQEKMGQDNMKMEQMEMTNVNKTNTFKGPEVNKGSATIYKSGGRYHVKWSDDFMIPGTPAPSWQIVDGDGNVHLLNQLKIVGDKQNRDIMLPKYIKSVSKVQIWCSFAEVVLGEASFKAMVKLN